MKGIVVFFNGYRGANVIEKLVKSGHGISLAVVPSAEKLAEYRNFSQTLKVPLQHIANVNDDDFIKELSNNTPTLTVIAGYSTIFKGPLLSLAKNGTINLHAGALPKYRGGSPLNWQILNGEANAEINVLRVDQGIDTGPVLASASFPIGPRDTVVELHDMANSLFPGLVVDVIEAMENGTLIERQQPNETEAYWHQRKDDDGEIHWRDLSAQAAYDMVRAITRPYPGAYSTIDGRRVRIFSASMPTEVISGVPGRVCFLQGKGPFVVCRDRAVHLIDYEFDDGSPVELRHGAYLGR